MLAAPAESEALGTRPAPVVDEWDEARFRRVALIQEAGRCHGQVELVEDNQTGRFIAVKAMLEEWVCSSHTEFLERNPGETELPWRDISASYHLSVVAQVGCVCGFVGVYRRALAGCPQEVCLAMEYCAGGDLFSWFQQSSADLRQGAEREEAAKPFVRATFHAVAAIHRCGVTHGDLSLENILLAEQPVAGEVPAIRLVDFAASGGPRNVGTRGKPSYQAPEMHMRDDSGEVAIYDAVASDAFALGVVAFTLVVGDYPWRSTRRHMCPVFKFVEEHGLPAFLEKKRTRNAEGEVVTLLSTLSASLVSLLSGLLAADPNSRFTLEAALLEPWLAATERSS